MWKKLSDPIASRFYIFNWTNPESIKNTLTKPNFQQLGPYFFREFSEKLNIVFHENNSTVSYQKLNTFFFDQDQSNGSLTDLWTTVNMAALVAASEVKDANLLRQKLTSVTLQYYKEKIHVTKTVGELLFDGYEDGMLQLAKTFNIEEPFERVGFMLGKNDEDQLKWHYNVHTGVDNMYELGTIKRFNYMSELPYHNGKCKELKGSTNEFFHPEPSMNEPIYVFYPELCRPIPFEYQQDVIVHGIKTQRFAAGPRAFDNGSLYKENECFASDEVLRSGLLNISMCNFNIPTFTSLPHFYEADRAYLDAVKGLSPIQEHHESYVTVEPVKNFNVFYLLQVFNKFLF
jgi:hypothetical protein